MTACAYARGNRSSIVDPSSSHIDLALKIVSHRHKVMGWSIKTDPKNAETVFLITFKRLPNERSMDLVLSRPHTDEVEDYIEYKRLRQVHREKQKEGSKPGLQYSADGVLDVFQDETAQTPFQEAFTDRLPDESKPVPKVITEASPNRKR